jgi:hypothetical protein
MRFAKLQQLARGMEDAEVSATLRQLGADPRFACVLRVIEDQKTLAADGSAQLKFAEHHGCLAHAAGVRYGLLELEGRLRMACDPPKSRTPQPPPQ